MIFVIEKSLYTGMNEKNLQLEELRSAKQNECMSLENEEVESKESQAAKESQNLSYFLYMFI